MVFMPWLAWGVKGIVVYFFVDVILFLYMILMILSQVLEFISSNSEEMGEDDGSDARVGIDADLSHEGKEDIYDEEMLDRKLTENVEHAERSLTKKRKRCPSVRMKVMAPVSVYGFLIACFSLLKNESVAYLLELTLQYCC